jgi:hypothetical protein
MTVERQVAYERQRKNRMAEMLESTERKLAGLYREARRYEMSEILDKPCAADAAWERAALLATLDRAESRA